MQRFFALTLLVWITFGDRGFTQEAREEILQKLLQRYPGADANQKGRLTAEEAHAYRQKLNEKSGGEPAVQKVPSGKKAKRAASPEIAPNHADISYGRRPNNKLSTLLIVFIHGGRFIGGDKSSASSAAIKQCLDAGQWSCRSHSCRCSPVCSCRAAS